MDHQRRLDLAPSLFSRPRGSHTDSGLIHVPKVQVLARFTGGLGPMYDRISNGTRHHKVGEEIHTSTSSDGCFLPETNVILGDRYEILSGIDGGGQSAVLVKAQDRFKEMELVVIKVMHTSYFHVGLKEAQTLNRLQSADPRNVSHTIRLLNSFMFGDHVCLVFPFLNPCSLTSVIIKKKRSKKQLISSIRKTALHILSALAFLRQQNTIHADVKPQNILVEEDGDLDSVTLIDFGNAVHHTHMEVSLYYNDFELQTPAYRAPEVHLGNPFGVEIDMWSLGCVLLELYTGEAVFAGANRIDMLKKMTSILGPLPADMCVRGKFVSEVESIVPVADSSQKQESGALRLMSTVPEIREYTMASFLSGLLSYHPDTRLKPWEALQHPFMAPEICIANFLPDSTQNTNLINKSDYRFKQKISANIHRLYPSTFDLLRVGTSDQMFSETSKVAKIRPLGQDHGGSLSDNKTQLDESIGENNPNIQERQRKEERMLEKESNLRVAERKGARTFISHKQRGVSPSSKSEPQEKFLNRKDKVRDADETYSVIPENEGKDDPMPENQGKDDPMPNKKSQPILFSQNYDDSQLLIVHQEKEVLGSRSPAQYKTVHSSTSDIVYNVDKDSKYLLAESSSSLHRSVGRCRRPDQELSDRMIYRDKEKKIFSSGNMNAENEPVVRTFISSPVSNDVLNCSTSTYVLVGKESISPSESIIEVKYEGNNTSLDEREENGTNFSKCPNFCVNSSGKSKMLSYPQSTEMNRKHKQNSGQTIVKNSLHSHCGHKVVEFCHKPEETSVFCSRQVFLSPRSAKLDALACSHLIPDQEREIVSKKTPGNNREGKNLLTKTGNETLHSEDSNCAPEEEKETDALNATFTLEHPFVELQELSEKDTDDTDLPIQNIAEFVNDRKLDLADENPSYLRLGNHYNYTCSTVSNNAVKADSSSSGSFGKGIRRTSNSAGENNIKVEKANTCGEYPEKKVKERGKKVKMVNKCSTRLSKTTVEKCSGCYEDKTLKLEKTNLLQEVKLNAPEKPTLCRNPLSELTLGREGVEEDRKVTGEKFPPSYISPSVEAVENLTDGNETESMQIPSRTRSDKVGPKMIGDLADAGTRQILKKSEINNPRSKTIPKTARKALENTQQSVDGEQKPFSDLQVHSQANRQNKTGPLKLGKSSKRSVKRRTCSKKSISYKCARISTLYTDKFRYMTAPKPSSPLQSKVQRQTVGPENIRNFSNTQERNTKDIEKKKKVRERGKRGHNYVYAKQQKYSDCPEPEKCTMSEKGVKALEMKSSKNKRSCESLEPDQLSDLVKDLKTQGESEKSWCDKFSSPLNIVNTYRTLRNRSVLKIAEPVIGSNFNLCLSGRNVHQIPACVQPASLQREADIKTQRTLSGKTFSSKSSSRAKSVKRALSFQIAKASPNRSRIGEQEINSPCHFTQSGKSRNRILKVFTATSSSKSLPKIKGVKKRLISQTSSTSLKDGKPLDPYEFIETPDKQVTGRPSSETNVKGDVKREAAVRGNYKRRQSDGKKSDPSANHIYNPDIGIFALVEKKTRQLMINTAPNKLNGKCLGSVKRVTDTVSPIMKLQENTASVEQSPVVRNYKSVMNPKKLHEKLTCTSKGQIHNSTGNLCLSSKENPIHSTNSVSTHISPICCNTNGSSLNPEKKRNLLPVPAKSSLPNEALVHLESAKALKVTRKRKFENTEDVKVLSPSSSGCKKRVLENAIKTEREKDVDQITNVGCEAVQSYEVVTEMDYKLPVTLSEQLTSKKAVEKISSQSRNSSDMSQRTVEIVVDEEILLLD